MAAATLMLAARGVRGRSGSAWRSVHSVGFGAMLTGTLGCGGAVARFCHVHANPGDHDGPPLSDGLGNSLRDHILKKQWREENGWREWCNMENFFGEVVDNNMLEKMPKYAGRPITQEDRAREAWNNVNTGDRNTMAHKYVKYLKDVYGNGASTMCLVYNSTGDNVSLVANHDWSGHIGKASYPNEIGNGQWAAFLHVHNSASAAGSVAAVVYRGKNIYGQYKDYLVAWSAPWTSFESKSAYCEIGNVNYFNNGWDSTSDKLEDSDSSSNATADGCQIDAHIGRGTSPKFIAKITAR